MSQYNKYNNATLLSGILLSLEQAGICLRVKRYNTKCDMTSTSVVQRVKLRLIQAQYNYIFSFGEQILEIEL